MKKAWWNSVRHWLTWADDSIWVHPQPVVLVQKALVSFKSGTTSVMLSRNTEKCLFLLAQWAIFIYVAHTTSMGTLPFNLCTQNVVYGSIKLASSGSLLDMQTLRPHLRPTQPKSACWQDSQVISEYFNVWDILVLSGEGCLGPNCHVVSN